MGFQPYLFLHKKTSPVHAEFYETHRIRVYLEELAAAFHIFYTFCRIIGSEKNLAEARLALAVTKRAVIKNGLTILAVTAPEKM